MREDFLHYIWQFGLFNKNDLQTIDGQKVQVVKPGISNYHAGPDFFNAKVYIDDALWAGNVEIHVNEIDWQRHGHQNDDAYNNVILHVVFSAGGKTINAKDKSIPVVELSGRIPLKQFELYERFLSSKQFIPCASTISRADSFFISTWLERVLIERLERKSLVITIRLATNRGDWFQTFWEHLAIAFGFKVNAQPMEMLARSIPHKLIEKYRHSHIVLESLLFGQAGFLDESRSDSYFQELQNEYAFLQKKHGLIPIPVSLWKFGRMRPGNFPTIRIAQLAALLHAHGNLFNQLLEEEDVKKIENYFKVNASAYWNEHYRFELKSEKKNTKVPGGGSVEGILINVVVPFLFAYGKHIGKDEYAEKSMKLLEQLPAEKNSIINGFEKLGIPSNGAARTQALLELKSVYCDQKKCLNCSVGVHLLKEA
jgi:hypothetical protein